MTTLESSSLDLASSLLLDPGALAVTAAAAEGVRVLRLWPFVLLPLPLAPVKSMRTWLLIGFIHT
jgi:hypothetical protein